MGPLFGARLYGVHFRVRPDISLRIWEEETPVIEEMYLAEVDGVFWGILSLLVRLTSRRRFIVYIIFNTHSIDFRVVLDSKGCTLLLSV